MKDSNLDSNKILFVKEYSYFRKSNKNILYKY